jgi:RND superfamily putative drug exporter
MDQGTESQAEDRRSGTPEARPDVSQERASGPARAHAWLTTGPLSVGLLVFWIAAASLAVLYLPSFNTTQGSLSDLTPANAPAIKTEQQSLQLFRLPALSRVAIVQRNPAGLPAAAQKQTVSAAVNVDRRTGATPAGLLGAFPIVNAPGFAPGAHESGTTAITYLFFDPTLGWAQQTQMAHAYARADLTAPGTSVVGVSGSIPARLAQENEIQSKLIYVEVATVVLVCVIVAMVFGSLIAPLVTLFAGVVAYIVALHLVASIGRRLGYVAPAELEPLVVVLLLGIVTDYVIFYLSGMRTQLQEGLPRRLAARRTTAQFTPIIVTAGLMVAASTAALLVATQRYFRDFGPGMAISVVVGMVVSVTLVPALLALFGRRLFWPRRLPAVQTAEAAALTETTPPRTSRLRRLSTHRATALFVTLVCVAALMAGGSGLRRTHLGLDFVTSLPYGSEARRAAQAAQTGFAAGILSPTEVIVRQTGLAGRTGALAALEAGIGRQPGVFAVIGPREQAADPSLAFALAQNGDAARFLVVFNADPLGSSGIARFNGLRQAMPALLSQAGLSGASALYAGDTALAQYAVHRTLVDLARIGIAVAIIDLLLLAAFLRSALAPVYLLVASVLALAASIGVTTYLFENALGGEDLTYFVPFAAAVLLVSLGSDYNVFLVGRIWEERDRRPLRRAIEVAVPRARRAISAAALALALSFSLLAVVNLGSFRELAFLLAVGVLIDSFFVRSLLVPALVALFARSQPLAVAAKSTASDNIDEERNAA